MSWKFWKKDKDKSGLPKPKDLPTAVGKYLVVDLKHDPDWIWSLKSVSRSREENNSVSDIRIFSMDTAESNGVKVEDYTSLDNHGDMVLFDGWYDKENKAFEINDCSKD